MIFFYCKHCKLDQDLKEDRVSNSRGLWFVARCVKCKDKLVRYITEKNDPYFFDSLKLREQRARFRKDLIQPGEKGFKTLYPKEWLKLESAREMWEKEQTIKKLQRDKFYSKNRFNNKEAVLKAIEIEENG